MVTATEVSPRRGFVGLRMNIGCDSLPVLFHPTFIATIFSVIQACVEGHQFKMWFRQMTGKGKPYFNNLI